jgi:hypothetical protein
MACSDFLTAIVFFGMMMQVLAKFRMLLWWKWYTTFFIRQLQNVPNMPF